MERCYGDNLELILRTANTHNLGVKHINYLIQYLLNMDFYWKDFAPRNVLVNGNNYVIVDFEKGINNIKPNIQEYFVDSVYEEYTAFLLPYERLINISDIFELRSEKNINMTDIRSNRVREILLLLGYDGVVPFSMYLLATKMIVMSEEPYLQKNEIIFPLLELEDFIKTNGRKKYAEKIIGDCYAKVRKI